MPLNLATAAQAQALLPNLSAAEATSITSLLGPASRAVGRWCRRELGYDTYLEYHRPGPTRSIRLKNSPVVPGSIDLRVELRQVLGISYLGTALRATCSITSTTLTLSAGGVVTPITLASLPTVADLAAAVAAVTGWTAAPDQSYTAWPVADLESNPGLMGAKLAPARILAFTRDLSAWAMDDPRTGSIELSENRPQEFRFPDRANGGPGYGFGAGLSADTDSRNANVRCAYAAGYDPTGTLAPAPPDDLVEAVCLTIRALYEAGQVTGIIKSVNLGNTTTEFNAPLAIPASAQALLSPYVQRRLG